MRGALKMASPNPSKLSVALFSGGRGTATITREILRHSNIELNLLVNAYDDGLSTGELRDFIPGMLGPSDFRKNLSYLLDLYSEQQFALERVIEYRLPKDFGPRHLDELNEIVEQQGPRAFGAQQGAREAPLLPYIRENLSALDAPVRAAVMDFLRIFLTFARKQPRPFNFVDCSLGNLVFAGAYLKNDRDFNHATEELATLFGSKANLINVTRGENRVLVALKQDGEILAREAAIVNAQSRSPIVELYLLERPIPPATLSELAPLSLPEKRRRLAAMEAPVSISEKAKEALLSADIIVYGPGTQHSSLFPSYKTIGVREAIRGSGARVKAFICNLEWDHDIRGLSAADLVGSALRLLGDPENEDRLVTHVLYNPPEPEGSLNSRPNALPLGDPADAPLKSVKIIQGPLENPAKRGVHSGRAIVKCLRETFESELNFGKRELDVYVDLNERSIALDYLLQEFLELPWHESFSHVRLTLNNVELPKLDLPPHLEVGTSEQDSAFTDVSVFFRWLESGSTGYLATIAGDGEYRLADVLSSITLLDSSTFGAVYGSRNQSRRQFMKSLNAAYGESNFLYYSSWATAFVLAAVFGARHQVIFSDPLTGFRVFKRSALADALPVLPRGKRPAGAMGITRALVQAGVEIAEVPISYRTFKGFTNVRWRITRGLKNAWSAVAPRS